MKKIALTISACVISIASGASRGADAPKGTLDFNTEARPTAETALIRTASENELQYKPSTAAKIFMPVMTPNITQMDFFWPADDLQSGRSAAEFESVRVLPGAYFLKVLCAVSGFTISHDAPIRAQSGKTYLIECVGRSAHSSKVTVREIEGS